MDDQAGIIYRIAFYYQPTSEATMTHEPYRNLRFTRRPLAVPRRLTPIGVTLAAFTLLWLLIPPSALYVLLSMLVGVLAWLASYGWREAVIALHDLLHRLSNI